MWIVRIALRRPLTFIVLALLIFGIGPLTIARTPTDIFPDINIPVVAVIWNYGGLSADEMSNRISSIFERLLTTAVNDVEHVEAQSLRGTSVVKVFFQPGAKIDLAVAQVTAATQAILRQLPPGITPPFILNYNASTVPVLQLALSGKQLSEQQLFDLAVNFLRPQIASINGAQIPYPYGGKQPQIQVDLDAAALQAKRLSPPDVVNALSLQNLLLPTGTQKIGSYEYDVDINASTKRAEELNDLPIRMANGSPIHIRDVAHVREGFPPQTNIVRVDGQRAVLLSVQKMGNASTLDIISRAKSLLPQVQAGLPPQLDDPARERSVGLRAGVDQRRAPRNADCREPDGHHDPRLPRQLAQHAHHRGVDSVVDSELDHRPQRARGNDQRDDAWRPRARRRRPRRRCDGDDRKHQHASGGGQSSGAGDSRRRRSDCASCSRVHDLHLHCLRADVFPDRRGAVPLRADGGSRGLRHAGLVRPVENAGPDAGQLLAARARAQGSSRQHPRRRIHAPPAADRWRLRGAARRLPRPALMGRLTPASVCFGFSCRMRGVADPGALGRRRLFPSVDGGQFKLHLRAPSGTRIEETAALSDRVEDELRDLIPQRELSSIIDNIGLPYSGINLSYSTSAPIGVGDADILVALNAGHHPTADYIHDLRVRLPKAFPGTLFSFVPSDIVTQILNFGLPAPIDVQVVGRNRRGEPPFRQ